MRISNSPTPYFDVIVILNMNAETVYVVSATLNHIEFVPAYLLPILTGFVIVKKPSAELNSNTKIAKTKPLMNKKCFVERKNEDTK